MTYGWAIIIIVIGVAALFVLLGGFGGGSVNQCNLDAPFNCGEVRLVDGGTLATPQTGDVVSFTLRARTLSASVTNNVINSITINGETCDPTYAIASLTENRVAIPDPVAANDARQDFQTFNCVLTDGTVPAAPANEVDVGGVGDTFTGTIDITYEKQGAGGLTRSMQGEISGEIEAA